MLLSTNYEIYARLCEVLLLREKFIVTYLLLGVSIGVYHRVVTESNRDYLSFCLFPISSLLNAVKRTGNHYSKTFTSVKIATRPPCIRLACGKFELTNQDSAGVKKSSVLTSSKQVSQ